MPARSLKDGAPGARIACGGGSGPVTWLTASRPVVTRLASLGTGVQHSSGLAIGASLETVPPRGNR